VIGFRSTNARLWLGLCLAIVAPRAYLAVSDQGVIWADEIFQTLEQAHRLAFGYGLVPWEFKQGARSWLLPGVLAALLKVLAFVGVKTGLGLAVGMKLLFAGLAAATFYPLLRMAQAWAGLVAAVLLAALAAVFPAVLLYGSRAMTEVATAPLLAWGIWLLWPFGMGTADAVAARPSPLRARWTGARTLALAGALFGLATVLRYQNLVVLGPIVLIVTLRSGWRSALGLALAMVVVLLAGGLLDWVTWGKPFQSLVVYVRFNLVEGGANQWGVSARSFYGTTLWATSGPVFVVVLLGFAAGLRRTWPVALPVLVFVAAHSVISHKELRFLYPVLPLFLLCSAVGLGLLLGKLPLSRTWRRTVMAALAMLLLGTLGLRALRMTFSDIGQVMPSPELGGPTSRLVWGAFDERNRLLSVAGTHADICGLAAPGINPYWTGGYTYFHRRLPLVWSEARPDLDAANYVLVGPGHTMTDPRFRPVAAQGPYVLYGRGGACARASLASATYGRLSPVGVLGP
jgi:phosphatidylinositol glycan class B